MLKIRGFRPTVRIIRDSAEKRGTPLLFGPFWGLWPGPGVPLGFTRVSGPLGPGGREDPQKGPF